MGTYYGLEIVAGIDRQIFFCEKGLPPSEFLTVFRPCDRASPAFPSGFEDSDEPYIPSHAYLVPVPRLVKRLEVMGFTLAALNADVKSCLKADLAELVRQIEEHEEQDGSPMSSYFRDLKRQRRLLEQFTLDRWVRRMRELRIRRILHRHDLQKDFTGLTPLQRHILNVDDRYDAYYFGLPVSDLRFLMRALLICASSDEQVFLDLTEIEGRHFEEGEKPVDDALAETIRLGRVCEKILVLTEGRTDTRILSKSLTFMYPHLADMYSFLDYEAFNLGGGTGNLASLVKGLAGVGIGNRVIAVFDNDAAGELQAEEVRKLKLPDNFRILTLPHLKFARRYPTIGPNGALRTDINGCACSIELYLGEAALTGEDGVLVPVQWKGYESKLKRYQGELLDKKRVEQRYLDALNIPESLDEANLASMRAVLQMIFTAFA